MPTSKAVISKLLKEGWIKKSQGGSHVQFVHPEKKGKVTVPHPRKDLVEKTYKNICRQAGWK